MSPTGFLEVDYEGEAIILTPKTSLGEYHCLGREFEKERIMELLDNPDIKNVVIDFHAMDYLGSTALALFVNLETMVNDRNGRMVLCNVSAHAREVFQATNLVNHWLITDSKEQALQAVGILQMS